MGFLDDLKRQADAAKAQQTSDTGLLERNSALVEAACKTVSNYVSTLVQQLNVLHPTSKVSYRLDKQNVFDGLRQCEFKSDSRRKRMRGVEVFDHVVLRWKLVSGKRITLVRNFLPEIQQLESRLHRSGAKAHVDAVRNAETAKLQEMRYELVADFEASITITPDHDSGKIRFELVNLDGFETVTAELPAFEVGTSRMDELARWIMGEPNAFLKGVQLRRIEA